jgi:hypothetical protein
MPSRYDVGPRRSPLVTRRKSLGDAAEGVWCRRKLGTRKEVALTAAALQHGVRMRLLLAQAPAAASHDFATEADGNLDSIPALPASLSMSDSVLSSNKSDAFSSSRIGLGDELAVEVGLLIVERRAGVVYFSS